jgi:hypothetical protein
MPGVDSPQSIVPKLLVLHAFQALIYVSIIPPWAKKPLQTASIHVTQAMGTACTFALCARSGVYAQGYWILATGFADRVHCAFLQIGFRLRD